MVSISEERRRLAAVGMVLRRREDWGAARAYTDARTVTEPASYQFVHITITNPDSYSSDDPHARAIERIGISRFPATGISYNRLIFQSGKVYEGQPIGRRGAHTVNDDGRSTCATTGCPSIGGRVDNPSSGNLNYTARSYVICQNVDDPVTVAQVDAIARAMAADRLAGFVVRNAQIHGHRCVSTKSCPGDKMWVLMQTLENKVNHYISAGLGAEQDWWDMATPEQIQAAVKAGVLDALDERNITLQWDGGPPDAREVSIYEALSYIHFNAADSSFVGTVPATSTRVAHRGRDTHAKQVQDALTEVQEGVENLVGPGEGDPLP